MADEVQRVVDEYEHEIIRPDAGAPARYFYSDDRHPTMVPLHFHDALELMYCNGGSVYITKSTEKFLLREGDVAALNINEMHSTICQNSNTTAYVIQILAPFIRSISNMPPTYLRIPKPSSENMTPADLEHLSQLKASMLLFFNIMDTANVDKFAYIKAKGVLCDILYLLASYFQDKSRKNTKLNQKNFDRIKQINEYCHIHYSENISLEEISGYVGLTATSFSRFFTKNFGMAFLHYMYQIRIGHAYADVVTTNTPLVDIALENGFSGYSLFNMKFKETYGLTPAQARRRYADSRN
jgi:AraC-like DNA-binding protein